MTVERFTGEIEITPEDQDEIATVALQMARAGEDAITTAQIGRNLLMATIIGIRHKHAPSVRRDEIIEGLKYDVVVMQETIRQAQSIMQLFGWDDASQLEKRREQLALRRAFNEP
jgi:hypothetical protein